MIVATRGSATLSSVLPRTIHPTSPGGTPPGPRRGFLVDGRRAPSSHAIRREPLLPFRLGDAELADGALRRPSFTFSSNINHIHRYSNGVYPPLSNKMGWHVHSMEDTLEYLEQATKYDALATQLPDHLRRVVTSISDLKARQAAKVREIGEALVTAGYDNLDAQAAVLGLSRSTTWTIIRGTHKSSGLSATVLNRMLSAPDLHPLVRGKFSNIRGEVCRTLWQHTRLLTKIQSATWRRCDKILKSSAALRAAMRFNGVVILWVVMVGFAAISSLPNKGRPSLAISGRCSLSHSSRTHHCSRANRAADFAMYASRFCLCALLPSPTRLSP